MPKALAARDVARSVDSLRRSGKSVGSLLKGGLKAGVKANPLAVVPHVLKAKKRWRRGRRGRRGFAGFINRITHTVVRPALNVATGGLVR